MVSKDVLQKLNILIDLWLKELKEEDENSDLTIFEMEELIARYSVKKGFDHKVKEFHLSELLNDNSLEDKDGFNILVSEYIGLWISVLNDDWKEMKGIKREGVNTEIVSLIKHMRNRMENEKLD